ncbi:hypothetical protein LSO9J_50043 [Candidatus Liberibacter solanacearum]
MLARTKINKIRYDTELKSCRKLKKTNFFSKKPEQVCPTELNEWKELIDIYEGGKRSKVLEEEYKHRLYQ